MASKLFPPFRLQGTIARGPFLAAAFALLCTHYIVLSLASYATYATPNHSELGHWSAFRSVFIVGLGFWTKPDWHAENWRLLPALAIDIAASWILVALSIRRAKTINRSLLIASFALVPAIQIPIIAWLGLSTTRDGTAMLTDKHKAPFAVILKGLIAGIVITVVLEILCTLVFRTYGFGLFLASPFFVGGVTAYIGNRRSDIGSRVTTRLVLSACFLGGVGLLAVALEGVICLVLATPLIAVMAWIGGLVGRWLALKGLDAAPGRTAMSIFVMPLFFAADFAAPPHVAFESVESIEVAATDREVWDAIVHMGPIPAPPSAPFRWGLAYPMSGSIHGSGVGAIREGVFSTGVAYERVTQWNPAKKLSFIVLSDPPTINELSPYRTVNAPHLNGYFRTLDARFTITPLDNGHTLLSLETSHELDLNPAFYWLPMAKWAIHANKVRVLAHFAQQAEAAPATEATR
jgi:hypothetical protein